MSYDISNSMRLITSISLDSKREKDLKLLRKIDPDFTLSSFVNRLVKEEAERIRKVEGAET